MTSPDLKRRILEAARQEPSPPRREGQGQRFALLVSALALPLALFLVAGGVRLEPRPPLLALATGAGAVAIAAVALWSALGSGSSMLGRARIWLIAGAVAAPLAFLAWKLGVHAAFPHMSEAWGTRPGYRCFVLSLVLAAWPFAVLAMLRRGSDPTHPRSLGLALGVAAGLGAGALVDLWCPVGHLRHVALGHLLPMGLLGLFGLVVGGRVLALRPR